MLPKDGPALSHIIETHSLDKLPPPVDLASLAAAWGVVSVEHREISSEAMLLPGTEGYKVILKEASTSGEKVRQRFSFAHELGHLLLRRLGYDKRDGAKSMHRAQIPSNGVEKLCDQIAAEILMPSVAFIADASEAGWSLNGLRRLARLYDTSVHATASRLISLAPETCHMAIWKPASNDFEMHRLQHSFGNTARYGIQNSNRIPRRRMWLISRAANGSTVESGISPLANRDRPSAFPKDVLAEAWAWGKDEHRRVLVFYYPERELTDDMLAVANATWRPF